MSKVFNRWLAAVFMVGFCFAAGPSAALPKLNNSNAEVIDAASLRSIAGWLKQSGREGYLAAEVADAVGIPRNASEDLLAARQRGFRNGEVLRIAQISADTKRDFVLFTVQQPNGEV